MRVVPLNELQPAQLDRLKQVSALALGRSDEAYLLRLLGETYSKPSMRLLALMAGGEVVGVAGFRRTGDASATLLHIAVAPAVQRQGFGRYLVEHVISAEGLSRLEAETDDDAVGFYRKCGFEVESLGEKYPGVTRYRCTWASEPGLRGTA